MFDSSPMGHPFRVLRGAVALAVVCSLSSLATLPRAAADGPICEITSDQVHQIVETHNWLRSNVRPTASNMRKLVSEILAIKILDLCGVTQLCVVCEKWREYLRNFGRSRCVQKTFFIVVHVFLFQIWNQELADAAQLYASRCIVGHNKDPHGSIAPSSYSYRYYQRIGENIDVLRECNSYTNYTEIIQEWYQERLYYDFHKRKCNPLCTCDRYLQV